MQKTMRAFHQIHMVPRDKNQQFRICCKGFPLPYCTNESKRDTTVLYSVPKRKLASQLESEYQRQCWNTQYQILVQSKLSLVKLPTISAALQVAQTWGLCSKSDYIGKCGMKKFLFRNQDFSITNVKMYEFRR